MRIKMRCLQFGLLILVIGPLLILVQTCPVQAGFQDVTVTHEIDQNASAMDMVQVAKASALVQAVHREATDILPASLPEARSLALEDILKPRAEKFVFSYSEQGRRLAKETLQLTMSVGVNTQALKDYLKSWGMYYTAQELLSCSVSLQGVSGEDRNLVDRYMLVTGIKDSFQTPECSLQVRQASSEPKAWELRLSGPEKTLTRKGADLESVWHALWSQYFSQPGVQKRLGQTFLVRVIGWTTSSEVQNFHSRLVDWGRELDTAELQRVDIQPEGLSGTWLIRTMDRKAFESRIRRETRQSGLEVSLASADAGLHKQ